MRLRSLWILGLLPALAALGQALQPHSMPASAPAYEPPLTLKAGAGEFQALIEKLPAGEINWTAGEILIEGTGQAKGTQARDIAMAKRAARLIALRSAVAALGGLRTGPGGTFDLADGRVRLDAIVEDFEEVAGTFDANTRTVTSKIRLPFYGVKGAMSIWGMKLQPARQKWAWPAADPNAAAPGAVVIDMRNTGFIPSLLPRFVSSAGTVFDATDLDKELLQRPAVQYVTFTPPADANAPRLDEGKAELITTDASQPDWLVIAGVAKSIDRPLILGDAKPGKDNSGEIVLSDICLEYFRTHPQARATFLSGRLIVVVDAPAPPPEPSPRAEKHSPSQVP